MWGGITEETWKHAIKNQMRVRCCAKACSELTILAPVSVLLLEMGLQMM